MSIRIESPKGTDALHEFVSFHDRVYAERGAFWPAFPSLDVSFAEGTGPVAERRRVKPLVARDGDAIVARALAVFDERYVSHWREPIGHLVKFEALPGSRTAVRALADAACEWLAEQGARAVRAGFGPLDTPFVIDDYTSLPPSILRFNPPYYHALLKDAGFETEQGFVDYRIAVTPMLVARWEEAVAAAERAGIRLVPLGAVPDTERAALLAGVFNESFAEHWGMSPIMPAEQATYLALFSGNGAFDTSAIAYVDDQPMGQVTVVPDATSAARVGPNRVLLPSERLNWLGIGVRKPARGRGVALALAARAYLELVRRGSRYVSYTLVLDDNWASRRTAERLGAAVSASYLAYRRELRG